LELTQEGKQVVANLYGNVFQVENESRIIQEINNTRFGVDSNGSISLGDIDSEAKELPKFSELTELNL
jgi:hypothetical protein